MTLPPEIRGLSLRAQNAFIERIAILSEGGDITRAMEEIATREAREVEALEIEREMSGRLEKLKGTLLRPKKEQEQSWMNLGNPDK